MNGKVENDMLSIGDFIRQVITDINEGLQCVQEEGRVKGIKISSSEYVNSSCSICIQFDLAVIGKAEVSQNGEEKAKIFCSNFGAGMTDEVKKEVVNRLQFTIPVVFFADNSSDASF